MPNGIYRIASLGAQMQIGAAGAWRLTVHALGKPNSSDAAYCVANEMICGDLGRYLRLPVPPGGIVTSTNAAPMYASLDFNLAGLDLPPVNPTELVRRLPDLATGLLLFDILIGNSDRHYENLSFDPLATPPQMTVFDHSHALLGALRGDAVRRLTFLADRLAVTGGPMTLGNRHCVLDAVRDDAYFVKWIARIRSLPDYLIEEVCTGAVDFGITTDEAAAAARFLKGRRNGLADLIQTHRAEFHGIKTLEHAMSAPTYLLAKLIPDLQRIEPRNIGVILWTPVGVAARFLYESPQGSGQVDGRAVPKWIASLTAYKQWIAYWRRSVSEPFYQPARGGAPVAVSSREIVQALQSANKGHFVLVEGGVLLDDVPAGEVGQACDHLFDQLVREPGNEREPSQPRELTLDERLDELLSQRQIAGNPWYRRDFPMSLRDESFIFSDALANGNLRKLYERVPLGQATGTFMRNAHHAAWQFEKVVQAQLIARKDTAAIVSLSPEQEEQQRGRLASLRSVTRVINLQHPFEINPELDQMTTLVAAHRNEDHLELRVREDGD